MIASNLGARDARSRAAASSSCGTAGRSERRFAGEDAAQGDEAIRSARDAIARDPHRSDVVGTDCRYRGAPRQPRRLVWTRCEQAVAASPATRRFTPGSRRRTRPPGSAMPPCTRSMERWRCSPGEPEYLRATSDAGNLGRRLSRRAGKLPTARGLCIQTDLEIALALARVSAWSGDTDQCGQAVQALSATPSASNPPVWLELAKAESWRGNYPGAIEALEAYKVRAGETDELPWRNGGRAGRDAAARQGGRSGHALVGAVAWRLRAESDPHAGVGQAAARESGVRFARHRSAALAGWASNAHHRTCAPDAAGIVGRGAVHVVCRLGRAECAAGRPTGGCGAQQRNAVVGRLRTQQARRPLGKRPRWFRRTDKCELRASVGGRGAALRGDCRQRSSRLRHGQRAGQHHVWFWHRRAAGRQPSIHAVERVGPARDLAENCRPRIDRDRRSGRRSTGRLRCAISCCSTPRSRICRTEIADGRSRSRPGARWLAEPVSISTSVQPPTASRRPAISIMATTTRASTRYYAAGDLSVRQSSRERRTGDDGRHGRAARRHDAVLPLRRECQRGSDVRHLSPVGSESQRQRDAQRSARQWRVSRIQRRGGACSPLLITPRRPWG